MKDDYRARSRMPDGAARSRARLRRGAYRLIRWGVLVVSAFAAMFLALLLTPGVSVSALGQTVQVGAVRPPTALSWSGPGEADLFGEGPVPTVQRFQSFIRPRIVWRSFDQAQGASQFIQSGPPDGRRSLSAEIGRVGQALVSGWEQYLIRLVLFALAMGVVLHLVSLGASVLLRRHDRLGPRRSAGRALLAALMSFTVTAAFAGLTVVSASQQLRGVTSLADLVGTEQLAPVPVAAGAPRTGVDVVVIGDSTAAGDGNALIKNPSHQDAACGRSRDSYAKALQAVTGSKVLNLSCSSATIANGLLGPQPTHGLTLLPQVSVLKALSSESAVIVSIGANDVGWSDFVRYCAVSQQCDDRASEQLFRSRLDRFKIQFAQLLQQLADLPGHPSVIVNQYYDPFGPSVGCIQVQRTPAPTGSATSPASSSSPTASPENSGLAGRSQTLRSDLTALNTVLARGARAFHDIVVHPDFAGHTLCTAQPWVQGLKAPAPFHPNAAGGLAIAAADLPRLLEATGTTSPPQG